MLSALCFKDFCGSVDSSASVVISICSSKLKIPPKLDLGLQESVFTLQSLSHSSRKTVKIWAIEKWSFLKVLSSVSSKKKSWRIQELSSHHQTTQRAEKNNDVFQLSSTKSKRTSLAPIWWHKISWPWSIRCPSALLEELYIRICKGNCGKRVGYMQCLIPWLCSVWSGVRSFWNGSTAGNGKNILTIDEAWVYVTNCNGRRRIYYEFKGEQTLEIWTKFWKESYPKGVMFVAGVCSRGETKLRFVEPGAKIDSQYYIDNVLNSIFTKDIPRLFPGELIEQAVFHHDSAPAHASKVTQDWLKSQSVRFIPKEDWMGNSPDMAPMDYCVNGIFK